MTESQIYSCIGSEVISLHGRDKNRPFIIVSADEENSCVYIADGKLRKVQKPKKKKLKHLKIVKPGSHKLSEEISAGITNRRIRELICGTEKGGDCSAKG